MPAERVPVTYLDKDGNPHVMYNVQWGSHSPARGEKWYMCQVCAFSYPASKVLVKNGKAFCYSNKCYLEAK
jgi:hypothetical protein